MTEKLGRYASEQHVHELISAVSFLHEDVDVNVEVIEVTDKVVDLPAPSKVL